MKLAALVLVAALNPLVVRSPEPHGNVPANCETSALPAAPRTIVADATPQEIESIRPLPQIVPLQVSAAPARFDAGAIQSAIARNDRATFDAELARAREAGVPTRVYEDVGRLWDAQFESPYFAADSAPHRIASQYPGYEAAVADQVYTDQAGRKFYPAAESRHFVARQAGVTTRTSSRATSTATPKSTGQPSNRSTTQGSTSTGASTNRATTSRATTSRATTSRATTTTQPRNPATAQPTRTTPQPKSPAARRDSAPPRPSPDPSAAPRRAAAEPAPVVPQVGDTSSTEASPAAGSLPPDAGDISTTTADPLATDTTVTDTMVTDSAVVPAAETATTGTTGTTASAAAPAQQTRSVVLPAILILIGLGVLILLFKAR